MPRIGREIGKVRKEGSRYKYTIDKSTGLERLIKYLKRYPLKSDNQIRYKK